MSVRSVRLRGRRRSVVAALTLLAGTATVLATVSAPGASAAAPTLTIEAGVAGTAESSHACANGPVATALLNLPSAVATFDGTIYVSSSGDGCVVKISPSGIVTPVAGTGTNGFNGNDIQATKAELSDPHGLAFDAAGDLFIADSGNNQVREVTTAGVIKLVAGSASYGYSGDGVPAQGSRLYYPLGVGVTANGSVVIADTENERVREVTPDGIIHTIVGNGTLGFNGDLIPAVDATVNTPAAVAIGPDGTIYFTDVGNNQVRSIDSQGIIHTVAGNSEPGGYYPVQSVAVNSPLYNPYAIALDASGDLFIADSTNCLVREVLPSGTISTVVGVTPDATNGPACGDNGSGLAGTASRLDRPYGIAVEPSGTILIADTFNQIVRRYGLPAAAVKATLHSSLNPATPGAKITYSAVVSPTPDAGTISYLAGGSPIMGCNNVALTATCTVSYPAAGSHAISVTYSGDDSYTKATSPTVTEKVT